MTESHGFGLFNKAGVGVEISARNGAKEAIENADLTRVFEQIKKQAAESLKKRWYKNEIVMASVGVILVIVVSFTSGWFIKSANPSPIPQYYIDNSFYISQLKCAANQQYKMLQCTDKYKNTIMLEWPGSNK